MIPISIVPLTNKQFKDCFESTVQFKVTSKNEVTGTDVTITRNINVLHHVKYFEAFLMWKSTFYDLSNDHQWTPKEKFHYASLLLNDAARAIWDECMIEVMAEDKKHEDDMDVKTSKKVSLLDQFNRTMLLFTFEYCRPINTTKIIIWFQSTKHSKPYHMSFRTFVSRIEQINRYLPLLPGYDRNGQERKLTLEELYYVIKQSTQCDIDLFDHIHIRKNMDTDVDIRIYLQQLTLHAENIENKKSKHKENERRRYK